MTSKRQRVFLFDVDGVIVNPVAYRLGIGRTLAELLDKISVSNAKSMLPSEHEISTFEANGVHDVWDITNIIFCEILAQIAGQATPIESLPNQSHDCTTEQLRAIGLFSPHISRPDYLKLAKRLAPKQDQTHPPDIAMNYITESLENSNRRDLWLDLISRFLVGTRSVYASFGTRLFQNIILGSDHFTRTYELKSDYEGPGLLRSEDRTLIEQQTVDELIELNARPDTALGIYTARPSLPPKDANLAAVGYSPEAEIALETAGLQSLPLIGMGMMEWLGKMHNRRTEDLTKPNTTQALAALINTVNGGKDAMALEEAYAIDKETQSAAKSGLRILNEKETTVFVFEDTISGIVPMQAVAKFLRQQGFKLEVVPLGIATNEQKKIALQKHCQGVFDDVNQAFAFACGR